MLARQVFHEIAKAKPHRLFIVADGPRRDRDRQLCELSRGLADLVDWQCQLDTDYSEKNLGSRRRIISGLKLVFSTVEEAIILEDDCVPAQSFFPFCELLLERYRNDRRIMEIGGCNLQLGRSRTEASYYFSKYNHTWGWATWKRAWECFDESVASWPEVRDGRVFRNRFDDPMEEEYWNWFFERLHTGAVRAWDYQWLYAIWRQDALSIVPDVNLVSNIGFGVDATRTRNIHSPIACLPLGELAEIAHPDSVARHKEADRFEFYSGYADAAWRSPLGRVRRRLASVRDRFRRHSMWR